MISKTRMPNAIGGKRGLLGGLTVGAMALALGVSSLVGLSAPQKAFADNTTELKCNFAKKADPATSNSAYNDAICWIDWTPLKKQIAALQPGTELTIPNAVIKLNDYTRITVKKFAIKRGSGFEPMKAVAENTLDVDGKPRHFNIFNRFAYNMPGALPILLSGGTNANNQNVDPNNANNVFFGGPQAQVWNPDTKEWVDTTYTFVAADAESTDEYIFNNQTMKEKLVFRSKPGPLAPRATIDTLEKLVENVDGNYAPTPGGQPNADRLATACTLQDYPTQGNFYTIGKQCIGTKKYNAQDGKHENAEEAGNAEGVYGIDSPQNFQAAFYGYPNHDLGMAFGVMVYHVGGTVRVNGNLDMPNDRPEFTLTAKEGIYNDKDGTIANGTLVRNGETSTKSADAYNKADALWAYRAADIQNANMGGTDLEKKGIEFESVPTNPAFANARYDLTTWTCSRTVNGVKQTYKFVNGEADVNNPKDFPNLKPLPVEKDGKKIGEKIVIPVKDANGSAFDIDCEAMWEAKANASGSVTVLKGKQDKVPNFFLQMDSGNYDANAHTVTPNETYDPNTKKGYNDVKDIKVETTDKTVDKDGNKVSYLPEKDKTTALELAAYGSKGVKFTSGPVDTATAADTLNTYTFHTWACTRAYGETKYPVAKNELHEVKNNDGSYTVTFPAKFTVDGKEVYSNANRCEITWAAPNAETEAKGDVKPCLDRVNPNNDESTITDTVKFEGLEPGDYVALATLVNDKGEFFDPTVTGYKEFTVKDGEAKGNLDVSISFNKEVLKGTKSVVVLEQIFKKDDVTISNGTVTVNTETVNGNPIKKRPVLTHEDAKDAKQTVKVTTEACPATPNPATPEPSATPSKPDDGALPNTGIDGYTLPGLLGSMLLLAGGTVLINRRKRH